MKHLLSIHFMLFLVAYFATSATEICADKSERDTLKTHSIKTQPDLDIKDVVKTSNSGHPKKDVVDEEEVVVV